MFRFFLLASLLCVQICFGAAFKIGILIPLSGAEAWWGEPMRNSIILAYEELGLTKDEVELVWEDWEGQWGKLSLATQKLINIDKVDAIINTFDKAGYIVAPLARKSKTPHVVMALDDRIADGEYNFTVWTPVQSTTRLLLQKAYNEGYRKIALFILKDYYPYRSEVEIKKQIREQFPEMEITYSVQFDPSLRDFRTLSMRSLQSDWDLGIVLGYPPSADILYKQLCSDTTRALTSDAAFDMFSDFSIIRDGAWWVGAAENTPAFNSAYVERFGQSAFTGVTYSYDCLKLLVAAYRKNPSDISEALKSVSVEGAGGITTISQEGIGLMDGYIKKWQNNQVVKAKSVENF